MTHDAPIPPSDQLRMQYSRGKRSPLTNPRPIVNLIWATASKYAVETMGRVRQRISRDTVILSTQETVGKPLEVTSLYFSDANSCPTFLESTVRFKIRQGNEDSWGDAPLSVYLKRSRESDRHFTLSIEDLSAQQGTGEIGHLRLGPVFTFTGPMLENNKATRKRRIVSSRYLVNLLLNAPLLNTYETTFEQILYHKWRKIFKSAVLEPVAVLRECPLGQLPTDYQSKEHIMALFEEAYSVVQHHLPSLKKEDAVEWLQYAIENSSLQFTTALSQVMTGHYPTALECNQLLVDHGKALLDVDCIRHRQAINDVLTKAKYHRLLIDRARKNEFPASRRINWEFEEQ